MKIRTPSLVALILCLLAHDYQSRILAHENLLGLSSRILHDKKEAPSRHLAQKRKLTDMFEVIFILGIAFVIGFVVGLIIGLIVGAASRKKLAEKVKKVAIKQKNKKVKMLARVLALVEKPLHGFNHKLDSKEKFIRWLKLAQKRLSEHKSLLKSKSITQTRRYLIGLSVPKGKKVLARKLSKAGDDLMAIFFIIALIVGFFVGLMVGYKATSKKLAAKKRKLLEKHPFLGPYAKMGNAYLKQHSIKEKIDFKKIANFAHSYLKDHPQMKNNLAKMFKAGLKNK